MKNFVLIFGTLVGTFGIVTMMFNNFPEHDEVEVEKPKFESSAVEKNLAEKRLDEVDPVELKREQMVLAFAELKEARKLVKVRLSRLSSRLRRAKFSPEQAKLISHDMRRGNYLLKNPKLLGAFSSVAEITKEREQLSEVDSKLDTVKQLLDEKRQQKP